MLTLCKTCAHAMLTPPTDTHITDIMHFAKNVLFARNINTVPAAASDPLEMVIRYFQSDVQNKDNWLRNFRASLQARRRDADDNIYWYDTSIYGNIQPPPNDKRKAQLVHRHWQIVEHINMFIYFIENIFSEILQKPWHGFPGLPHAQWRIKNVHFFLEKFRDIIIYLNTSHHFQKMQINNNPERFASALSSHDKHLVARLVYNSHERQIAGIEGKLSHIKRLRSTLNRLIDDTSYILDSFETIDDDTTRILQGIFPSNSLDRTKEFVRLLFTDIKLFCSWYQEVLIRM